MDFDYAHYMVTEGRKDKENNQATSVCSPSKEAYRKQLAEVFNMNRTRILAFKNKPPTPVELIPEMHSSSASASSSVQQAKLNKPRRHIPQVCSLFVIQLENRILLNRLDWIGLD